MKAWRTSQSCEFVGKQNFYPSQVSVWRALLMLFEVAGADSDVTTANTLCIDLTLDIT